ncbi:MAG: rod shape-determining protein MreC [Acidimicrobiales bacterium]
MAIARSRGSRTRTAVLILAAVSLLALDERDTDTFRPVREASATVLGPFEDAVERASRPLREVWHEVAEGDEMDDLRDENEALRAQVDDLEADAQAGEDAQRQLAELEDTLELESFRDSPQVTAEVTSGPRSNLSLTVEINKGSDHGIRVGMPVVTSGGLVGRVSQVSGSRSNIELVTNPAFRVGVRLADTGALGTARGQGRSEPLVVDSNVEPGAEVAEGAGLVTSGVDRSTYPDGIPVAQVTSTREGAGGLSLELVAEPLVDVSRLSFVNVILWEPPT